MTFISEALVEALVETLVEGPVHALVEVVNTRGVGLPAVGRLGHRQIERQGESPIKRALLGRRHRLESASAEKMSDSSTREVKP